MNRQQEKELLFKLLVIAYTRIGIPVIQITREIVEQQTPLEREESVKRAEEWASEMRY